MSDGGGLAKPAVFLAQGAHSPGAWLGLSVAWRAGGWSVGRSVYAAAPGVMCVCVAARADELLLTDSLLALFLRGSWTLLIGAAASQRHRDA